VKRLKKVGVGGTFDVLHKGHEVLLGKAFEAADSVVIGLTTDEMVGKETLPYEERENKLCEFLASAHPGRAYDIVGLEDAHGPAVGDAEMDAIVVSEETLKGAEEINRKRLEKGLSPLEVIVIPMVLAHDGKPISSSRIRAGEIDGEGRGR